MRIKLLMILILPLLLLECQSLSWNNLTKKESKLFSETEKIMINETTASVDFKYGYDPDLEFDYVYKAGSFTDSEISAKSPEMKKVLLKYSTKEIISFYEKIVQLKEIQVWKMNYLRDKKKWVNSTYLQKYILPETEQFYVILENNVRQIDAAYGATIEKRKTEIKNYVVYNKNKELEYQEKKLREQRKPAWK
ncbi:MAG TPA: hypothetical protein PLY36_05210 [Spirochaetota bacterium]|nr:hypothetical protein [Spirochaetota bacterium]